MGLPKPMNKGAITSKPDNLQDLLTKMVPQLKMVLPRHLTPERLVRIALTAIKSQPKLLQCDKYSILKAIMEAAQLGLEPDGLLGHAYLIPYWNSKKNCYEAQLQVGYRGFLDLARRSGQVSHIFAQVVYEKDHFKFAYGTNPNLEHVPAAAADRGKKIAAYAIAYLTDGRTPFEVMYRDQIEKIREMSKRATEEDSPWNTHEDEMWRKTVIRRLAKYLPLSPELTRAAVLDEYREMGIKMPEVLLETEIEGTSPEAKTIDEAEEQEKKALRDKIVNIYRTKGYGDKELMKQVKTLFKKSLNELDLAQLQDFLKTAEALAPKQVSLLDNNAQE